MLSGTDDPVRCSRRTAPRSAQAEHITETLLINTSIIAQWRLSPGLEGTRISAGMGTILPFVPH